MIVAAYIPNIFDRSRFGGELRDRVVFVDDADRLADLEPAVIIVDLDRCDDPASFAVTGAHTIGFGPHVDTDAHQSARNLGFTEVLPRSVFFRRLPDLLSELGPDDAADTVSDATSSTDES